MSNLNQDQVMLNTISDGPIGTGILAFRDLPTLLKKHVTGTKALDFGCGAGRSSRLLKHCGFNVTGVDISEKMIEQACKIGGGIRYLLTKRGNYSQIVKERFDLILISCVLMKISSRTEIDALLTKLSTLLARDGKIIVIAASDNLYYKDWLSIQTNYPTNHKAKSGEIVKVFLKDYGAEISDYLWSEEDCE